MQHQASLFIGTAMAAVLAATAGSQAAPTFSWSGFYIGAQGGGAGLTSTENDNPASSTPSDPYYWALSGTGVSGGVFAGYNRQITDMFVLGIEGDVNVDSSVVWYDGDKAVKTWDAGLKAKFGTPIGNGLLYALAGVTVGHFDYSDYWTKASSGYGETVFDDIGGQLGIGVQTQLTDNVFGRVEAVASLYGKHTITSGGSPYWDVWPSSLTVKAGIGVNLGGEGSGFTSPTRAAFNWTGFYVGINGGITGLTSTENYNPAYTTPSDPVYWAFTGHGASGGFFGGYNYQLNDHFVLGAEGELNSSNARIWYDGDWIQQNWDAALKVKFGMPMGNTLLYGLAGVAVSQFDYSNYWTSPSPPYSDTLFSDIGGQVGIGAQTQFTDNLFGRIELAGTYYGKHTIDWTSAPGPYWDVWPSTVSLKAGIGFRLP